MPSRSPYGYQRRKQLRPINWPASRFAPDDLLIHKYPTGKTEQKLKASNGSPPPDRARMVDWSAPTDE
jgi:hypothetical protein